jgi:hypothetical protein
MPRGSQPGERRGGRQRGTLNKKTALKNAVLCAAAGNPNASALDFMLGLMRDSNLPTDLRIEMATAVAPFVHSRPQAPTRKRTNPMDLSPIKSSPDFTVRKMEETLSAPGQCGDGGDELSPLNFLLSVMKDPDATPKWRIRAARVAARYQHAPLAPDKMPAVDEYGFSISDTLAKAIRDDWLRLDLLESGRLGAMVPDNAEQEIAAIRARQAERDEILQCPPGYDSERDLGRWVELLQKERRRSLTAAENTELARVFGRVTAFMALYYRTPQGRAHRRVEDLRRRLWRRSVARAGARGLTPAEESELNQLRKDFPAVDHQDPADDDPPHICAVYFALSIAEHNDRVGLPHPSAPDWWYLRRGVPPPPVNDPLMHASRVCMELLEKFEAAQKQS